ncbi:MAG: hypothetical protein JWN08_3543, partial [Frankiales bacterium]|nr:hypothetical protein [Frankiales bacterium]
MSLGTSWRGRAVVGVLAVGLLAAGWVTAV